MEFFKCIIIIMSISNCFIKFITWFCIKETAYGMGTYQRCRRPILSTHQIASMMVRQQKHTYNVQPICCKKKNPQKKSPV